MQVHTYGCACMSVLACPCTRRKCVAKDCVGKVHSLLITITTDLLKHAFMPNVRHVSDHDTITKFMTDSNQPSPFSTKLCL